MFWNINRGSVPNLHLGSRWQRVPIWRRGSSPEIQASGDPESGSKMHCPEFQLLRRDISKNHSEALSRGDGALGASSEALDAPLPHPMGLATKHSWATHRSHQSQEHRHLPGIPVLSRTSCPPWGNLLSLRVLTRQKENSMDLTGRVSRT